MTEAEDKLAEFEDALPDYWRVADREGALREIMRPDGLIHCYINHSERGGLITRVPVSWCRKVVRLARGRT